MVKFVPLKAYFGTFQSGQNTVRGGHISGVLIRGSSLLVLVCIACGQTMCYTIEFCPGGTVVWWTKYSVIPLMFFFSFLSVIVIIDGSVVSNVSWPDHLTMLSHPWSQLQPPPS